MKLTYVVEIQTWRLMGHPEELLPVAPTIPGMEQPGPAKHKRLTASEIRQKHNERFRGKR